MELKQGIGSSLLKGCVTVLIVPFMELKLTT